VSGVPDQSYTSQNKPYFLNGTPDTGTVPGNYQVPIHQASSDLKSGRPSARCWGGGWGWGDLGTSLSSPRKIAQVRDAGQQEDSCNKWSFSKTLFGMEDSAEPENTCCNNKQDDI